MGLGSLCFHFFFGSGTLRQSLIFLVGTVVWIGQVTFPGFEEVGLLVASAFVFFPALAAAVDVEGLAQQAGQGVGGHGVAVFAPFVPGAVVQAVQVVQDFGG